MSADETKHKGSCHCGAVRYELTGDPQMVANCHCRNCQKSSGAGHVMHLGYMRDHLQVSGETNTYEYTAGSGSSVSKRFCPSCGTNMFGESTGMPSFVTVAAATLDEPSAFEPQVAVFAKHRQAWDHDYPDIPAFEEMPPRG